MNVVMHTRIYKPKRRTGVSRAGTWASKCGSFKTTGFWKKKKQAPVANNTQNEKPATTKAKRVKRQVRTKLIK